MATLYLSEFAAAPPQGIGVPCALWPPIVEQTVSIGGSSTQASPFNTKTTFVRVHTDSICSIEVGANPTATTSNARLAANQTEYFGVVYNSGQVLAVIANS